jgi:hypothetical protein
MAIISPPSADFISHYDRERFMTHRLSDELETHFTPADDWAKYFGETLYDYIADGTFPNQFEQKLQNYANWNTKYLVNTDRSLNKSGLPLEEQIEAHGRLHYHRLNSAMIGEWFLERFREHPQEKQIRNETIIMSEDLLSLGAVRDYIKKYRAASQKSEYSYFNDESVPARAFIEGRLNEFDAGILLLEISRKNSLTVLPAPPQFESGIHPSSNADFVVIAEGLKPAGVQIKSSVTEETIAHYDDHIVLIDARADMGNEMVRRTELQHSNLRRVGWAGIISAQRAARVNMRTLRQLFTESSGTQKAVLNLKSHANSLIRDYHDELPTAIDKVTPRLLKQLGIEAK